MKKKHDSALKEGKFLKEEIIEEKEEIDDIDYNIKLLKDRLIEKVPTHFSIHNIVDAFFGALLIGLTFILKGAIVTTSLHLNTHHIIAVIAFTIIVIFIQVYFISYKRVREKDERRFVPFVVKRMASIVLIAIGVSTGLVYLLAINLQVGNFYDTFRVIVVLWMSCAVGSAIPGLLKEY